MMFRPQYPLLMLLAVGAVASTRQQNVPSGYSPNSYSSPDIIDNELVAPPTIRCTDRGVEFSINTRNTFRGNIYVQGQFGLTECRREFYNNNAPFGSIEVGLGACGMIRERRPRGMAYSLVIITNFHPRFITRVDRAFKILCSYQQAERPVGVDLEVGSVPTEPVQSESIVIPDCEYTMRVGEVNGPPAPNSVKVGDLIYHRWECQHSEVYGMLVKNCRVFDGGIDNVTLLDERGCPTHTGVIQSAPVYSDSLNLAFAPVFAFHFPDRTQMNFRCQIQSCNKMDGECQGLTPPSCPQQNYGAAYPTPYSSTYSPTGAYGGMTPSTSAYQQQQQQQMPFIGAGLSPSWPPNVLPLGSVLQGNPSQVLQGLQRPRQNKHRHRTEPREAVGGQHPKRLQQELEQQILLATQQLRRKEDGRWPPSLVILNRSSEVGAVVGQMGPIARRFFRPLPPEVDVGPGGAHNHQTMGSIQLGERELRQRQRRAEEHTQDVVASSTVINDGLQGLDWSYENGKTRVRPWDVSDRQRVMIDQPQCMNRSTLVTLVSALGMLGSLALSLGCFVCWDLAIRGRRCGKRRISWRLRNVASGNVLSKRELHRSRPTPSGGAFASPVFAGNQIGASKDATNANNLVGNAQTLAAATEKGPQAMLANILNAGLPGLQCNGANGNSNQQIRIPPPVPPKNVRRELTDRQ